MQFSFSLLLLGCGLGMSSSWNNDGEMDSIKLVKIFYIFLVDDTYDLDSFRTYKAKRFVPANLLGSLLRLADNNMTDNMDDVMKRWYQKQYEKHIYE